MESATSQEEADVQGAYFDFRTPFQLILMDEKLFFHPSLKKKKMKGKKVAVSKEHRALHDLLSYLESICELLSLNKMKFVKLIQHTNFGREKTVN